MQNKLIKKYAPLAIFGIIFYSGIVNAEENINAPQEENRGGVVEVEHESEDVDDDIKLGSKIEDRKARLDQKFEERKMKLDEKKLKFDQKIEDKKIKIKDLGENEIKKENNPKREEMLKNVLEKRKEFELKKEELKTEMKSKTEAAKEALKKTLGAIKDEKKKASVENIANIIDNANKNTGTRFTNTVNSIENVLVSIKSRSEKVGATGTDTGAVLAEIATAETLISDARTAITTQSAKVYSIDTTDPTKVKELMKTTRDTFNADIKSVQEKVKAARDGVKKAADSLKKITPKQAPVTAPVTTETTVNTTN